MIRVGNYLQDRYEILEKIGSGGMSDVYKAKCHKLNRLVAIKVLKEEFSTDTNFVAKFKMEAQAAAGLSHPNIVNVYDVVDEGEIHYIVMELIEGITLKNYILKKGKLESKETIGIAIQVAQGMSAAHEQHIIHRDIKPQNMIISRDGKVKVADFGIARAVSSQTIGVTAMGSVHYISPEQARGGYSDERSDIYSLGITMYEMVTGRLPFEGENTVSIALAHLDEPITPPRAWNPNVPVSLEKIILKCTEKKPERRYNNAEELIVDLRRALLTPDMDFVQTPPVIDHTAPTLTISEGELQVIKNSARRNDNRPPKAVPVYDQEARGENKKKKKNQDDDIDPKIEKLMTGVGIVVAIIIVAVMIVIFAQLGGLFNFTSRQPDSSEEVSIESTETTSEALKDTEVYMPDVRGMTESLAEETLKKINITMRLVYDKSDEYEKGLVMAQEKEPGAVVNKHSTVTVTISEGSDNIDLATMGLMELELQAATNLLQYKGVTVETKEENSETIEKGKLIRFEPVDKVKPGETVTFYVSSGPKIEKVIVPDISGSSKDEAKISLESIKLVLGSETQANSNDVAEGRIISQDIDPGTQIDQGTAVNYVISMGPEQNSKYIARIDESYSLKSIYGPGSDTTSIEISIVFKQIVDGKVEEKTLMEPRTVNGNTIVPIRYEIEGAYGVFNGDLEVRDLTHGTILKSYPLTFVEGSH